MPSFSAAFPEAENKAHAEYHQYYAKQEDLWKTESNKASEQRKPEGLAQEACNNGAAALIADPASSNGKREHDLLIQIDEECPPAVEILSQVWTKKAYKVV
jgi:hypothetical protein